jgi:hypothetical protein
VSIKTICVRGFAISVSPPVGSKGVAFAGAEETTLLTQRPLLNRERESSGESGGQSGGQSGDQNRRRAIGRELSRHKRSPQVVARTAENDKRRELSLSASCVNWVVGGNSAD